MYRITIRATDEAVPGVLIKAMEDWLALGVEGLV
jgi:AP-2 complex subunit alpha